jgi:hypothetical protein
MTDFEHNDDQHFQVLEDQSNNSKFQVCKGQTDEERREIRKQQRLLQRDIEERGQDLLVTEARDRNNKIFSKVRFIREAVLDGENVNLIASKAAQKVDQLIQVRVSCLLCCDSSYHVLLANSNYSMVRLSFLSIVPGPSL